MMDDSAVLEEYLSESEELLDSLLADLDLLGVESSKDLEPAIINRIFRTVHSLKGLAGTMGLGRVQSLAHSFEDVLDHLRLGRLPLDQSVAQGLQEAGAVLSAVVCGAARGTVGRGEFERLSSVLSDLESRRRKDAPLADAEIDSLGLSGRERGILTLYEEHRILENLISGRSFYRIVSHIEVESLERRYRELTSVLSDRGELIATLPGKARSDREVAFTLVFATTAPVSEFAEVIESLGAGAELLHRGSRSPGSPGRKNRSSARKRRVAQSSADLALESLRPLSSSVRVELSQIDGLSGLAHELAIEARKLSSLAARFLDRAGLGARDRFDLRLSSRRLQRDFHELEERLVELRMVSLAQTFTRAGRLATRLARELGKSVSVEITGRETQLDKMIVDRIAGPIYHVLRNAIDHGIETPAERSASGRSENARLTIEASLEGTRAVIAISDDGRGIDLDRVRRRAIEIGALGPDESISDEAALRLIFVPGFSTAGRVSSVSGRGVGLDDVERTLYELGGEIRVFSEKGKGSRFELVVPTTLVMIPAFIVGVADWRYAVSVGHIIELVYTNTVEIRGRDGKRTIEWRGLDLPLIELRYLLGLGGARVFRRTPEPAQSRGDRVPVLVSRVADQHVGIAVERFEEQKEIIVKSLGALAPKIRGVIGAVDLEGGDVALVLELPSLLVARSLRL